MASSEFIALPLEFHETGDRPSESSQWLSTIDTTVQQTTLEVASDAAPPASSENSEGGNPNSSQTSQGNEGAGSQGIKPDTSKGYRGTDGHDEQDDDEPGGRDHTNSSLTETKPVNIRNFGTFMGLVRLSTDKHIKQELEIRFDLQILPEAHSDSPLVNCNVALHKLVVSASRMYIDSELTAHSDGSTKPYFVLDEICIIVGPSCGQFLGPSEVNPLPSHFLERQILSTNTKGEFSFEASATPKAVFKGGMGSSKTSELPPISLAVTPISIGLGARKDSRWHYKVGQVSETLLEMSSKNPPIHNTMYEIPVASPGEELNLPDNFKIMVQARYRRKGRLVREKSSFPSRFRFTRDVAAQHLTMILEARIGSEGLDYFEFPGSTKKGSQLSMDMNFMSGKIGQGNARLSSIGVVESNLAIPNI
jgi:hypothetical protein